jgi:hypothetical protein
MTLCRSHLFCRSSLWNLSLQAEAITSPGAHLAYLERKYSGRDRKTLPMVMSTHRCKVTSALVPRLLPGEKAIVTAVLTLFPPSPPHLPALEATRAVDQTPPLQAIRRILQLHGGLSSSPPSSVQIALSCLVQLRVNFLEGVSPSPSTPRITFCSLLSIPPEVNSCSHFDPLSYNIVCQRVFYPLPVTPLFPLSKEREMWEHLQLVISSLPQTTERAASLYSVLSPSNPPLSYQLLHSRSDSSLELDRLMGVIAPRSVLVLPSTTPLRRLFLELSVRSLSTPLIVLSSKDEVTQLHLMTNPFSMCPQVRPSSTPPSLHEDLQRAGFRLVSSTKLTKGAVQRLLEVMKRFLDSLMSLLKLSAVAWREMNLVNSLSARATAATTTLPAIAREVGGRGARIQLGSRLFTDNQGLYEDFLQQHFDCDQAMVSLLTSLQEFQHS